MTANIANHPRTHKLDRTWWGLAAIVLCFCVLGVISSVVVPLFETPDEVWHFSFVQALATRKSLPVQSTERQDMWLRESGQPPLYYLIAALAVAPLDTLDFPDFVRFNVTHPAVTPTSTSNPPNVFIHTPYEAFPYTGAVLAIHIVRLMTVLWGAGTVVGSYLVAREVAPGSSHLALMAAAITAFNAHFVFVSGAVNNDAAAAFLCTLVLWLTIRLVRIPTVKAAIALGLVLGLALLSKLSALALLVLVVLALWFIWRRNRDWRALLIRGSIIMGLAAVIAAWWYLRNWVLYGDPLAWRVWLDNAGTHHLDPGEFLRQIGRMVMLFWVPYEGLFPQWVFWALGLLLVLAVVGWLRRLFVQLGLSTVQNDAFVRLNPEGLLLASVWFVLLFVSLLRFMTITPAATGRLLFPGIAVVALFIALGLDAVIPSTRSKTLITGVVIAGLLALSIASPLIVIAPQFALPLVSSIEDIDGALRFDDAEFGDVRLLGAKVAPEVVQIGETVNVTLYWETLQAPPADLRAVVRLWTAGGRLAGQRDTQPAGEAYPPDLWRAGDIVRDVHRLGVGQDGSAPAMIRVAVSVLSGDELLGETSSPLVLSLTTESGSTPEATFPLMYTFDGKIELIGYDVPEHRPSPGGALEVTFYWRALAEMDEDYSVFVHVLRQDGTLHVQGDGPPLNNDYPTSHWSPGEVLVDEHVLSLEDGLPVGAYMVVGLYRLSDGTRLPVHNTAGEPVSNDAIVLDILE